MCVCDCVCDCVCVGGGIGIDGKDRKARDWKSDGVGGNILDQF